jgi:CTP synthase (UTP-ammonia lyase)
MDSMAKTTIGIIGDYNPHHRLHSATVKALTIAGNLLATEIQTEWLATDQQHDFSRYDGLFCSPGSPYKSLDGSLEGIRFAREKRVPFIGTCAGFQHAVLEFARNVLGQKEADHGEYHPQGAELCIIPICCSPYGKHMKVMVDPMSKAAEFYGAGQAIEAYYCNFGLNPTYENELIGAGLQITGRDTEGEARIIELSDHPFFLGTLFVPQEDTSATACHPFIFEFCRAALHRT